jgi:hypothetical protein
MVIFYYIKLNEYFAGKNRFAHKGSTLMQIGFFLHSKRKYPEKGEVTQQ